MDSSTIDDPIEEALLGSSLHDAIEKPFAPGVTRFTAAVYFLIILLGSLAGLGPLAIDMYLPSFPTIANEFGVSVASIERTLAAYFVGLAIGQLFYGPAADRFGRKRPLYVGLVTFIVASVGCALAHGVHSLIALRFLQAMGGCAEMVIARAIVRDRFAERDAARVFSSLVLVMGVAPILAPLIGGRIVTLYGWRMIFWVLTGFASICLVCVALLLPESHPPERRRREGVWTTVKAYGNLLKHRTFMAHTVACSLASAGLFAYVAGCPFVFIELFHVPASKFGWLFGSNAAGLIGSSQINGYLVRSGSEPHKLLRNALLTQAVASVILLGTALTHAGGFAGILVPLFVAVGSMGFIFPNATALAMAPHGRAAGNASAVLGCLQFLISGFSGFLVSALHNGTALPMAELMAVAAVAALIANVAIGREARVPESPALA